MSEIAQTGYVAIAAQAVRGTPVAPTGVGAVRVNSFNVSGQTEMVDNDPEIGGGRDVDTSAAVMAGFSISGELEAQLRPRVIGMLLRGAGFQEAAAPVQDATTGAYTHTFAPGALTYLTLAGRWGQTDAIRQMSDCLVNELSFSLDAGGKVTFSASMLGRIETFGGAAITPTYETDPVANYAGSQMTLDGITGYLWESFGLSIANNISDDEWVIGSRFLDDLTPAEREVTMSGTLKVGRNNPSLTDLYRAAVYGSKTATTPGGSDPYHTSASAVLGSPRLVGTSSTKRYGLSATIADGILSGFPLEASGSDRLTAEVELTAVKGASDVIGFQLVDGRSTVY